ncbi:MAG: hypothetical protein AAFW98_16425, partial [Pseudomonadota bacterium]
MQEAGGRGCKASDDWICRWACHKRLFPIHLSDPYPAKPWGKWPMADAPIIPIAGDAESSRAASGTARSRPNEAARRLWQRGGGLSSAVAARAERFLASAGFDRAPWLAVMFAGGILAWFALRTPWQW